MLYTFRNTRWQHGDKFEIKWMDPHQQIQPQFISIHIYIYKFLMFVPTYLSLVLNLFFSKGRTETPTEERWACFLLSESVPPCAEMWPAPPTVAPAPAWAAEDTHQTKPKACLFPHSKARVCRQLGFSFREAVKQSKTKYYSWMVITLISHTK